MKKIKHFIVIAFLLSLANSVSAQIRVDSSYENSYNEGNILSDSYLTTYFYDEKQQDTLNLFFEWDFASEEWFLLSKDELTYDSEGNLLEVKEFDFDAGEFWLVYKTVFTYDAENRETSSTSFGLNDDDILEESRKFETTYDENDLSEQGIQYFYSPSNNEWNEDRKYVTYYNSDDYITSEVTFTYLIDTEEFELEDSLINEFDANNNHILTKEYDNEKELVTQTEVTYTENDRVATYLDYYVDQDQLVQEDYMYVDTLNANGDFTSSVFFDYDFNLDEYVPDSETKIYLSETVLFDEVIYPYYYKDYSYEFTQAYEGYTEFEYSEGIWEKGEEEILVFSSSSPTSIKNTISTTSFNVFPNPSSSIVTIQTSSDNELVSVQVFDVKGSQVFKGTNQTLDVSSFEPGLYSVKANFSDNTVGLSKFAVAR